MRCRYCSTVSHTASGFCPNCGMPYDDESFVEDSSEMTNLVDPTEMNSWMNPQKPMSEEQSRRVPKIQNPQAPAAASSRPGQLPPVIPSTPKKKSHKRTWILLSVLIIVFIAGSGLGYYFSNNKQTAEDPVSFRLTDTEIVYPEKREAADTIEGNLLSRAAAVRRLYSKDGYTTEDAVRLVDSLDMDWNQIALTRAKEFLRWCAGNENYKYSEKSIQHQLVAMEGFTIGEAQWAVAQINKSSWFDQIGIPGWKESDENDYEDSEWDTEIAPDEYYLYPFEQGWEEYPTGDFSDSSTDEIQEASYALGA